VDILRQTLPAGELPTPGDCCLSAIVTAELRTGLARRPTDVVRERKFGAFMSIFPVRDFDDAASLHYGDIRGDLERRGISIGPLDLLIAAHARSLSAALVTGNLGDFRRVKGLNVVSVSARPRWFPPAAARGGCAA
jgi:tRNA(fMet)-specific endonuclease VapC